MSSPKLYYLISLLQLLGFFRAAYAHNTTATIPINKTLTWGDKQLYGDFFTINATSTLQVNLAGSNKNVSFVIIQVHSHLYNVTLYNNTLQPQSVVVGTNVGLYSSAKPVEDIFYVYNQNNVDLKVYVTVHGYDDEDPIPGGCNMEFPTPISPYMRTSVNKDYILVDMAPAKWTNNSCEQSHNFLVEEYYMLYIRESNYNIDTYFDSLQKMLTLDNIMEHGTLIPESGELMRRRIAAYPGTGAIYVAVAYVAGDRKSYSVYVPDTSYGCNILEKGDCAVLNDRLYLFLCLCLYCIGVFLCYFGHQFFKTEMFLIGFLSGLFITYVVISMNADIDENALLGASVISGICFGGISLLLWWFYGVPVLSMVLPALNTSFIIAAIGYYANKGGAPGSWVDTTFWFAFIMVMATSSVVLLMVHSLTNFICSSLIGSYVTVFSVGFSVGSHLNYIVINVIRRAVVDKFNYALTMPPFDWKDGLVCLSWFLLFLTGIVRQRKHSTGRYPYPPPHKSVRSVMPGLNYGTIQQANRQDNEGMHTENENVSSETSRLLV